jgi:hypothetical protein
VDALGLRPEALRCLGDGKIGRCRRRRRKTLEHDFGRAFSDRLDHLFRQ